MVVTYSLFGQVLRQLFDGLGELGLQMFGLLHDSHGFIDFDNFLFEVGVVQITQRIYRRHEK